METLKLAASWACHTTRTLVKKNEPKLPWSEDKFQTPLIFAMICSCGNRTKLSSLTMDPRSFKSRYNLDVSYALGRYYR